MVEMVLQGFVGNLLIVGPVMFLGWAIKVVHKI